MIRTFSRCILSLLLAVMVIVSAVPMQAWADQTEVILPADPSVEELAQQLQGEDRLLWEYLVEMNALLVGYVGTETPTEQQIVDAVIYMEWDRLQSAMAEIEALADKVQQTLSDQAVETLCDTDAAEAVGLFYDKLCLLTTPMATAATGTHTPVAGVTVSVSGAADNSMSGGVMTVTAKGSLFSKKTATVTIYNDLSTQAYLEFDWSTTSANSVLVDGASASAAGSYSKLMEAGGNVVVKVTSNSGLSNTTATLKLSDFSVTAAQSSSQVTFDYDSTLGSITVGGAALAAGASHEVTLDGIAVSATAAGGAKFLGWVNKATREVISASASFTLTVPGDMAVEAVFVGANSAPYFSVGTATKKEFKNGLLNLSSHTYYTVTAGGYLFDDLNQAGAMAASSSLEKYMVLLNNGTLPAGNYTIPAGVTLLIPFDSANTLYTTDPQDVGTSSSTNGNYTTPSAYRTLSLASGASLSVQGSLSLSAKHNVAQGAKIGCVNSGAYGHITMASGSSIAIKNGGSLYAWGFITGIGNVVAESGASVYEYFQFCDFRGGSQSTEIDNGVFPLSQYYVQNIEVPFTVNYGAKEYSYTSIHMSSTTFSSSVEFFSTTNGMFNLASGSVTKRYDGATDRLLIELDGDMTLSSISLKVGTSTINSKDYELPITNNITVQVNSGHVTLGQDVAMLPGSQIVVCEGASGSLKLGNNVYVYDADEWGTYASAQNKTFCPLPYAPGRTYTRTDADLVDASICVNGTLDASAGYAYTTQGGANIYSTGNGVIKMQPGSEAAVTYQMIQAQDVSQSKYIQVPLTSAKLKNADGSWCETTITKGTYEYADGVWNKTCAHDVFSSAVTTEPTCTTDGVKTYNCAGCDHTWTEAVAATGHSHQAVVTVPTCTEAGFTIYTCTCGDTYVADQVAATGHTFGDWTVTTEPTCTEAGEETRTCACGATETREAAAKGHSYVGVVTEPTCTEAGFTTYTCACGDSYVADQVAATGHTFGDWTVTTEPTCTKEGEETRTCACGASETRAVAVLSHTPGEPAACTTDQVCTVCDTVLVEALGHEMIRDDEVPSTCTQPGSQAGAHCTRCDYTEGGGEVAPKGHLLDGGTVTTEPTCTEEGVRTHTCLRDGCGHTETSVVAAKGHSHTGTVTEPTCTEQGFTTYTCTCGDTYVADFVAAKGHTFGAWVVTTEPTCTEAGEETRTCTCGATETREAAAKGHSHVGVVTEPTCTEQGFTTYTCTCGDTYVADFVAAKGHTFGVWTVTTEPTCTEAGEETRTCACGASEAREVAAKGHSHVGVVIEPTCTEQGFTTYTCACGDTYVADFVAAKGHSHQVSVVAPTCTEAGYTVHLCTCGDFYTTDPVAALGHNMVAADCTTAAHCQNKGCFYTEGAPLGHKAVIDEEMPPFCNQEGLTAGSHCSVCGAIINEQEVIPALGHDIVYHEAKVPTYTGVGWEAYEECTRCAYSTYVEIDKLPTPTIRDVDTFMTYLALLEELANSYAAQVPGKDPIALVIKYIRTGVERYNEGSWGIMAGYEDAGFAQFVATIEDEYNSMDGMEELMAISSLKKLANFTIPNGDMTDFGHLFGTLDITYHNYGSTNHADVAGWAGDIVDLITLADGAGVESTELEDMVREIVEKYFFESGYLGYSSFSESDMYGDLDGLALMQMLDVKGYEQGDLTMLFMNYFTENLTDEARAAFFLNHRIDGVSTRSAVRDAVYNAYATNKMIATLEGTRELTTDNLELLRRACCYVFADYVCRLGGDYVDSVENDYYTIFSAQTSVLAPGVTQEVKYATSADGKQMVYYLATADLTRDDVSLYANYKDNDPSEWGMQTVLGQANAAQAKYGDENSAHYIPNYNVIVSTNGAGYNMETGEPGGLLVMGGVEYQAVNSHGFFGVLKDGTPVIGTAEEYKTIYKDQVQEGISCFGTTLIRDGEICVTPSANYTDNRASRTAAGITRTGKVVLMVLDGRQEPFSCGGSMEEIAQIMLEAGCVQAVNLDGGGSSTYVAKQAGDENLSVINRPSDGTQRSVASSLMVVSTAPSSTAFDHALVESEYDYMTVGTSLKMTAEGISATGNAAELPEDLSWSVSDTRWASISEDGVLTALRNGSVEVYLTSGEQTVGSKTIQVVVPDQVYYTKTDIMAVYGSTVALPVVALYNSKPVAVNDNDLIFTLRDEAVGRVDQNFNLVVSADCGIKTTKVVVALVDNTEVTATINVALYNQGEATFDFDQATGGDRMFAWYREIENSITQDNIYYEVVDPDQSMTTSYIFAIDMTAIPIPPQLDDLTSLLPGADMEDASAWNFLLQLAQRVSDLSQVQPVISIDPNFDVDYSEMTIVNEYFELKNTEFDEQANTLTLTLNWKKQSQAIDASTANPLCIVSGLKVTPKEGVEWPKDRLTAVHGGKIGYTFYLRANALYSFSLKEENQATYGLQPFINPNDSTERGGAFGSTYAEFTDTYTLVKTVKNGWVAEDSGFAYYVEGERLTGLQEIGGLYYDLGATGIVANQTPFTGLRYHEDEDLYRYYKLGVLLSGWHEIDGVWHYFDGTTKAAVSGRHRLNRVWYEFEKDGKLVSGVWMNVFVGWRYYYGPSYYTKYWQEIDGNWYYFQDGCRVTGIQCVGTRDNVHAGKVWCRFDENGVFIENITGMLEYDGKLYYCENGKPTDKGLFAFEGDVYCTRYDGSLIVDQSYYAWNIHESCADIGKGHFMFGSDGKMLDGIVEVDGVLYYYERGVAKDLGLFAYNGGYYCTRYDGSLIVNQKYYVWNIHESCSEIAKGHYEFGPDGKMLGGNTEENVGPQIVEKDGVLYYYENGKATDKGLFRLNGANYCTRYDGSLIVNETYYAWNIHESCAAIGKGHYEFGADGKMLEGIVEKDGVLYFYELGKTKEKGLFIYDGSYYFSRYDGSLIVNETYYAWKMDESCADIAKDHYEFGADGKMLEGIVEKDGVLYFYELGKPKEKGLFAYNGGYYFSRYNGALVVDDTYYAWKMDESCADFVKDHYEFGPDGKMLEGIVEKDGVLYIYERGKARDKGLFAYNGGYYFSRHDGSLIVNDTYYAWKMDESCADFVKDHYEFGPDGKMVEGIVERDGVLYYYERGKARDKGLFAYNGSYYFSRHDGSLIVNDTYYAWKMDASCADFVKDHYEFDENGRMLEGIVEKDGVLYYYERGKTVDKGLFILDGYYYFTRYDGSLVANCEYFVWKGNDLLMEKYYIFNELGQIIG